MKNKTPDHESKLSEQSKLWLENHRKTNPHAKRNFEKGNSDNCFSKIRKMRRREHFIAKVLNF